MPEVRFASSLLGSALVVAGIITLAPSAAHAFCRTTTCALPADWDPTQSCVPPGLTQCQDSQGDTIKNVPLWWKSACAGYSIQKDASKYVPLADAETTAANAFAAWTKTSCNGGTVGIDVRYLGSVACADATYKTTGPNQNAIVFRDASWPHKTDYEIAHNLASPEIALTTMSFDPTTGEMYGGYVEINNADYVVKPTNAPAGSTFDLATVLTHESGHFLGMAHSAAQSSVMYFADREGAGTHRTLGADDIDGICATYPPGGARIVDTSVDSSGKVQATTCDATPRHGFASDCGSTTKTSGCACAAVGADTRWGGALGTFVAFGALGWMARRRSQAARRGRVESACPTAR
jgi:hypothetical protein